MRLPILYTMSWPERIYCSEITWPRLDLCKLIKWMSIEVLAWLQKIGRVPEETIILFMMKRSEFIADSAHMWGLRVNMSPLIFLQAYVSCLKSLKSTTLSHKAVIKFDKVLEIQHLNVGPNKSDSMKIYSAIGDGTVNLVDKFFEMQRHDALKALDIY